MSNLSISQSLVLSGLVVLSSFGAGAIAWIFTEKKQRAVLIGLALIIPLMMAHFYVVNP